MLYPDEFVTRFFFKTGLADRESGRVLEIGCGAGQNLQLFAKQGWAIAGIDIDFEALNRARSRAASWEAEARFIQCDLTQGFPEEVVGPFDVILMPSSTYYLGLEGRERVILRARELLGVGGFALLRERLLDDYRYGRGELVERNTFRLATHETGEAGLKVSFFSEFEVVQALARVTRAEPASLTALHNRFQNMQGGLVISNSDLVAWGSRSA